MGVAAHNVVDFHWFKFLLDIARRIIYQAPCGLSCASWFIGQDTMSETKRMEWVIIRHRSGGIHAYTVRFPDPKFVDHKHVMEMIASFAQQNIKIGQDEWLQIAKMDVVLCRTTIESDLATTDATLSEAKSKMNALSRRMKLNAEARKLIEHLDSAEFKVTEAIDVASAKTAETLKSAIADCEAATARRALLMEQKAAGKSGALYCVKMYASHKKDGIRCSIGPFACLVSAEAPSRAQDETKSRHPGAVEIVEYSYVVEPDTLAIPADFVAQWLAAKSAEMAEKRKERVRLLDTQISAAQKELAELTKE